MAVVDKYVSDLITGNVVDKLLQAINAHGAHVHAVFATEELAAGDDDGSVYRFFKNVDPNLIPLAILVGCDAITGGTDFDFGIYKPDLGAVIDKDVFMDGQTLATAAKLGLATALNGMGAVDVANYGKRIYEHAGHTVLTKLEAYDLALTGNTVGTAAGTVSVIMLVAQG